MPSVEQLKREVQSRMQRALEEVESGPQRAAAEVEVAVWEALLGVGQALMGLYLVRQAESWPVGRSYRQNGQKLVVVEHEPAELGTKFGKVSWSRPVGRDVEKPRQARDMPLSRELGLVGGFTLSVVTILARLCAQMPFAQARELFRLMTRWAPSPRAVLRMVDAAGEVGPEFLEQASVPDDDGEVLVVLVDSKGAPSMSSREQARRKRRHAKRGNGRHQRRHQRHQFPRTRRGPGKKSKNAKMATLGVLYTLHRCEDGTLEGPCNKHVIATFDGDRALFKRLLAEAKRRGYGTKKFKTVQFISDGAKPLRLLQKEFFPDAERCLDWAHAVEYLWSVGKAICRNTRRQRTELEAWVHSKRAMLRQGKIATIITELEAILANTASTGPGNKFRRQVLTNTIRYFKANQEAMNYKQLRSRDLEISSGVCEGAVRHVVGLRLDGPGMRWGRDRAEAVLQLRCILVNGQWPEFERYLARHPSFHLASQPVPARPHDAALKEAA